MPYNQTYEQYHKYFAPLRLSKVFQQQRGLWQSLISETQIGSRAMFFGQPFKLLRPSLQVAEMDAGKICGLRYSSEKQWDLLGRYLWMQISHAFRGGRIASYLNLKRLNITQKMLVLFVLKPKRVSLFNPSRTPNISRKLCLTCFTY